VALEVEKEKVLAEEAKERQIATLKQGNTLPDREFFPYRENGKAVDLAAKKVGTNGLREPI
jgi:hypothetical protein